MIPFGQLGACDWCGDVAGGGGAGGAGPLELVNPGPGNFGWRYFLPLYPPAELWDTGRNPVTDPQAAALEAEWRAVLTSLGFTGRYVEQPSGWIDNWQRELGLALWRLWANGWPGVQLIRSDGTPGRSFPPDARGFLDFAGDVGNGAGEYIEAALGVDPGRRYGFRIMPVLVNPVLVSAGVMSAAELQERGAVNYTQLLIDVGLLPQETMVLRTTGVADDEGFQDVVEVLAAGEDVDVPDRVFVPPTGEQEAAAAAAAAAAESDFGVSGAAPTVRIEEADGTVHAWTPSGAGLALLALGAVFLLRGRR